MVHHLATLLPSLGGGDVNYGRSLLQKKKILLIIYFQIDVANVLEEDVSSLQVRCDELALQVTQLTQGKGNLILLLKRGLLRITLG